jgi:hypothetical protein
MKIEFLWFQDCANRQAARELLRQVLRERGQSSAFADIDATQPEVARPLAFPGSPTIRIDGRDIEPGFEDPGDYMPRCRVYLTEEGLRGMPKREWIEAALVHSQAETDGRAR